VLDALLEPFISLSSLVGSDRSEESGSDGDEESHGGDYNAIAGSGGRMRIFRATGVEDNCMKGRKALARRWVLNYNKNQQT
jgi:hypothetical protein